MHLQVDQSTLNNLAENQQLIEADGGLVIMTAGAQRALLASVVNNTGIIEARTVENHEGTIELLGGMSAGTVKVGGTLDASAPKGGNGGFIETDAAHVEVANDARVTTAAPTGLTGSWLIDPEDFTVAPSGEGDITGAALSKELTTTSVTLESSKGSKLGSGNVNIDDTVSWYANTKLTLTASNDVNVNDNITARGGSAALTINPNTANGPETASGKGTFNLGAGVSITLSGADASLSIATPSYTLGTGAQINLPNVSPTSTTALTIGGTAYTVINSLGAAGSITGTDLQGINGKLTGHYALGNNINAVATATWNSNGAATPMYAGFTPIGTSADPFTGTFEGLGHTISDLTIYRPTTSYVGLIGKSGKTGVIRDVGLIGGSVSGSGYVGALVGQSAGAVSNSYATGSVAGTSYDTGGLVGQSGGAVSESYATGSVGGAGNGVGGLVGQNNGAVNNSYATGSVASPSEEVGGLVGQNPGTVSSSYATGNVRGAIDVGGLVGYNVGSATIGASYAKGAVNGSGSAVGGLVGRNSGNIGSVANSFWDLTTSGQSASAGGTGLTTAQMQTVAYLPGFAFTSTPGASGNNWVLVDINGTLNNAGGAQGATFPMLASEYTTRIDNAHQLQLMAMNPAATYALNQNIDASTTGNGTDVWNSTGFIPIGYYDSGNSNTAFTGTLDGLLHTVSDLTINLPSISYPFVGLIGFAGTGSVIEEIGLVGGSISGYSTVGTLVGQSAGTVNDSYATANVTGGKIVGGLIGNNYGTVSNSYATGQVTGTGEYVGAGYYVGGLVGKNQGTVSSSYATGNVSGEYYVGGLIGINTGTVSGSYATGDVSGNFNFVAGLVGLNDGAVSESYATGNVSDGGSVSEGAGTDVGGLVGYNGNGATVSGSYATGNVTGSNLLTDGTDNAASAVGGIVGNNVGTVSESYAKGAVTGTYYVGGLIGINTGSVSASHAAGQVTGDIEVGGLVGYSYTGPYGIETVTSSYAKGSVSGDVDVGGLVGYSSLEVSNSYATGNVSGGTVGGLVGFSSAEISNSYATGNVGGGTVGGLVGYNSSEVSNSHATGNVGGDQAGGLVGLNGGTVSSSYATGSVSGGTASYVGGLVGINTGTVSTSYSTGSVSGSSYIGGLVGSNGGRGTISSSYATGSVSGTGNDVGGLVGYNYGTNGSATVSSSYATGSVSGTGNDVGGLVGYNAGNGAISSSYATGNVTGASTVGGLVGDNAGSVADSYARGSVRGSASNVGGLVGLNGGMVSTSYSTGGVSGSSYVGGLVGDNLATVSNNSFWNVTTSGLTTSAGGIGMTTAQMQTEANFTKATSANGNVNPDWNFTSIWYMSSGTYPMLQAFESTQ